MSCSDDMSADLLCRAKLTPVGLGLRVSTSTTKPEDSNKRIEPRIRLQKPIKGVDLSAESVQKSVQKSVKGSTV